MEEDREWMLKKARRRAMYLLQRMDRTEENLRQKLLNSYPPDVAEEALEYVKSYGYVDDERYARNYLAYRIQSKSRQKLFLELYQKGVARQTVEDAWAEVSALESVDEKEILRRQICRKYESGTKLDEKEMRRLYGFLARKGFRWEDIRQVLDEEGIALERGSEFGKND